MRDEQRISLEEAHYRLSALPAHAAGFRDRGILREGAPADILQCITQPSVAMSHGMGFLTEDRKETGCFLNLDCIENIQVVACGGWYMAAGKRGQLL